ncbi:hypothetical protein FPT15_22805 [Pseudomonas sp. RGB]|nr:hypothetical protein FPT15_22805 [Pseudomonas sp. RGB]
MQPATTALLCFSVGAGLPAMQTPRCIRHNQSMLSQASQLPHLIEFSFQNQVGCQAASAALLILILGAPLNHAGRTQVLERG